MTVKLKRALFAKVGDVVHFFTFSGIGDAMSHILVEGKQSWKDARSYCWNISSDLVIIDSEKENGAIRNMSSSESLWIGLFKDPWKWSNGSKSSFRFWDTGEPKITNNRDCVAANLKKEGRWSTENCSKKLNFICHGENQKSPD
uniref:C-type lectin domain-containing protein n=1 Tax=Fundulus heteroclitus TaxID=8078 RepID=A0A3Q2QPV2_FUNHE